MNRAMRRAQTNREPRRHRPERWFAAMAAMSEAPQTQEQVTQLMLPVYAALDNLQYRDLDDESMLLLIEMFSAGYALLEIIEKRGGTGALEMAPTFATAAAAVAEVAARHPRRATGNELRDITEAITTLDQLVEQSTQGMVVQALRSAVEASERAYRSAIRAQEMTT